MRLARAIVEGQETFLVAHPMEGWTALSPSDFASTGEVIAAWPDVLARVVHASGAAVDLDDRELLCPVVRPGKILAIGLNYRDHIRETGAKEPERPVLFAKFSNTLVGPYDEVVMDPELTEEGDYEVELAVVIGRRVRKVSEADALEAVFGYAVANDVSARDWQRRDPQFDRSKSFDTFCPIGPWITTSDEIGDPQGLRLRSWVDDELRQDSTTGQMLFQVAHLVSFLSRGMTLEPGDLILTGTPPGVGMAMEPPRFLKPGSTVACEVQGLGRIVNPVVAPDGSSVGG